MVGSVHVVLCNVYISLCARKTFIMLSGNVILICLLYWLLNTYPSIVNCFLSTVNRAHLNY